MTTRSAEQSSLKNPVQRAETTRLQGPAARVDEGRAGAGRSEVAGAHSLRGVARMIHGSPRSAAQRRRVQQSTGATMQRRIGAEEEELQMKPASAQPSARAGVGASTGLPAPLRTGIESLSGVDTSDVRVHRNSPRPAGVGALAFAQGSEIHLARGQEHHLPHEAWHVVQQRQGRVRPTLDLGGVAINDDVGLEREADRMGSLAARRRAGTMG